MITSKLSIKRDIKKFSNAYKVKVLNTYIFMSQYVKFQFLRAEWDCDLEWLRVVDIQIYIHMCIHIYVCNMRLQVYPFKP